MLRPISGCPGRDEPVPAMEEGERYFDTEDSDPNNDYPYYIGNFLLGINKKTGVRRITDIIIC